MLKFNNKVLKVNDKWLKPETQPIVLEEVLIGNTTWKTKNLAIDDGEEGIIKVDNVTANGVNFGTQYYYTWQAALRIAEGIEGWRLPVQGELEELLSYAGTDGNKLKSTRGWDNSLNGTDEYGFNLLPVGEFINFQEASPPHVYLSMAGSYSSIMSSTRKLINHYPYYRELVVTVNPEILQYNEPIYLNWHSTDSGYLNPIRLVKES
jgi:uncharacterized protein (TIGR02145 family)